MCFQVLAVKDVTVCRVVHLLMLAGLCGLGRVSSCQAEDWTTVRGRIVYSQDAPRRSLLDVTRDEDYCGPFGLKNETVVVNQKNRGLRNVAIFLRSKKSVAVHPSYAEAVKKSVTLDNEKCRFTPRMQTIRTGQTWKATSTDTIPHNVAVFAQRNDPFSQIVPQGAAIERVFAQPESRPIRVDCSIHAWMRAYLIITDHPYAAVTDKNGGFEIAYVPCGIRTFRFWHERPGYVKSLVYNGKDRELKSGNWSLEITGDVLDLGELTVDARMFQQD